MDAEGNGHLGRASCSLYAEVAWQVSGASGLFILLFVQEALSESSKAERIVPAGR